MKMKHEKVNVEDFIEKDRTLYSELSRKTVDYSGKIKNKSKNDYSKRDQEKYYTNKSNLEFKNTVKNIENALKVCVGALKNFRPLFDFSPVASVGKDVKVVQKNFTKNSISQLSSPTIESVGLSALKKTLAEMDSLLEGGIQIDLSEVNLENIVEAKENIKSYQDKLDNLKKKVTLLGSMIDVAAPKFNEMIKNKSEIVKDENYGSALTKESKQEIVKIKEKIAKISIDLSEGINMIDYKFPSNEEVLN
jgi:hypothetical protein